MVKALFKYGILVFFGGALLYQFLPIGDYCGGLLGFFYFLFFGGLILLAFLIITIIDLVALWKKKRRFDFIPLILVLVFGALFYLQQGLKNKKFWTEKSLSGGIEIEFTPKSGYLQLYKNGTFGATFHSADYSCTFQGDYELKEDTLRLKRPELPELTNGTFATEYLVDKQLGTITPSDPNFGVIQIVE